MSPEVHGLAGNIIAALLVYYVQTKKGTPWNTWSQRVSYIRTVIIFYPVHSPLHYGEWRGCCRM